ncbi:MAG: 2-C-methyl-D-erythritol 2,4-cyclodiphosphate synthase [Planctomycetes bacterium]|jgi:2-C-methyl-D-erythritol 2,4-cyclodiphosphate synthase|nr:2-C-methyl-D-erythritol 2,4-cyclodiphosphate synthase [Planctomycetota bacterium]
MRIGHGYDLHRLDALKPQGSGRPFVLGGVRIDAPRGPVAHSDGDALLHAVTDAVLGALGLPDIGQLFPDQDPRHDGADSAAFLRDAVDRMHAAGFQIGNIDCTVICEVPKVGPHKESIASNIARLLCCGRDQVNVKGKTHERVDAVGEGRAIEVHVVALLVARTAAS